MCIHKRKMRRHEFIEIIFWNAVCQGSAPITEDDSAFADLLLRLPYLALNTAIIMSDRPSE